MPSPSVRPPPAVPGAAWRTAADAPAFSTAPAVRAPRRIAALALLAAALLQGAVVPEAMASGPVVPAPKPAAMPSLVLAAASGATSSPAREAASPAAARTPLYRTRVPPPVLLSYALRRGSLTGSGTLDWKPQGDRYTARLEGKVLGVRAMALESRGAIDGHGLVPTRFTDERRGRGIRAADFQRTSSGGKITYSDFPEEIPLPRGTQDRLSWMVQLAAIGAADPARVGPGGRVSMFVSGARADADVWTFVHVANEAIPIGDRTVNTLHLVRERQGDHGTRAEVWLDPTRHYLPVRARLYNGQGRDAGDAFELLLAP